MAEDGSKDTTMTNPLPANILEQRADEQRRRLHYSVTELRSNVKDKVRERLDARRIARQYLWQGVGFAAIVGLAMGYRFTGFFTRD